MDIFFSNFFAFFAIKFARIITAIDNGMVIVAKSDLRLTSHHSKQGDKRQGIIHMCWNVLLRVYTLRVQPGRDNPVEKHCARAWCSKDGLLNNPDLYRIYEYLVTFFEKYFRLLRQIIGDCFVHPR